MYSLILHGRRLAELQKWRHLRDSVKLFQNASSFSKSFSSASVAGANPRDGRKGEASNVSYLVDSLGITTKLAQSISKKVSFEDKGIPDSVLSLLRNYGFTNSQISSIFTSYPRLLIADAEKSLGPKLQFLKSRGASTSELTEVLSKVPKILGMKEGKASSRYYDFVKEIIEADKSSKKEKLCLSLQAEGSQQENKIRNVLVLRELGMPRKLLFSLLISNFKTVCGKEKFEASLNKVVEMGFDPTTSKFVEALNVVYGMTDKAIQGKINVCKRLGFAVGDVWAMFKKCPISLKHSESKILNSIEIQKRCGLLEDEVLSATKKFPKCVTYSEQKLLNSVETFLGLGFSRDEILMMIKRRPPCISYSVETVKTKIEFLVKKMNWPLKAVVLRPQLLGYSMEKRIVPRCNVIKALLLQGSELPLISSVLVCTEKEFLNRYVRKHDDKQLVGELIAIFTKDQKTCQNLFC